MSSVCGKGEDFGSDDSQESSDGDETGYIDQTTNDEESSKEPSVVLIPAIKGSREKHGLLLKKVNVTWAADVYDPIPSLASHTRNKKQQQHQQHQQQKSKSHRKGSGKKGQKSKDSSSSSSSRGGGKGEKKSSSRSKHSRDDKFDWVTQMPIVAASS